MFKKILFSTTGTPSSDAAARVAFDMARKYKAQLTIIHVFGVPSRSFSQTVTDVKTGEVIDLHDDHFETIEASLKNRYTEQIKYHPPYKIEVLTGVPHTEILRCARKKQTDLIVMGVRVSGSGEDPDANRHIVGRTYQGVARSAKCPVLSIGRAAASFWGGISNIVFGTDFSRASDSAFEFAFHLSKTFNASLNLFHSIDISADPFEITKDQEAVEDRIQRARQLMRQKYIKQMDGFNDYDVDVWEGIPYVEIVKYAREKFADLIIMAHHTQKTSISDPVLGSTVEQVVLRSNAPVISVNRPDWQQ